MKAIHKIAVPEIFATFYLIDYTMYNTIVPANSLIYSALYLQYFFKYFRHIRSYEQFFNNSYSSYLHLISSIISYF